MGRRADSFDLNRLRMTAGEARRLELEVAVDALSLGADSYRVGPEPLVVRLEVARTTNGYALRLRFSATVSGPCMRCLGPATPGFEVDVYEVWQPQDGEQLDSPYLDAGVLDLGAWTRDALVLSLPAAIICRDECAGLCAVCGADLASAGPDHAHAASPDPRWAKLAELRLG